MTMWWGSMNTVNPTAYISMPLTIAMQSRIFCDRNGFASVRSDFAGVDMG